MYIDQEQRLTTFLSWPMPRDWRLEGLEVRGRGVIASFMMLRNTWGGVGRNSILELAHMADATQHMGGGVGRSSWQQKSVHSEH